MDRYYTIFTLVFSNENTFKNSSKEECKNLLDVSCSMSMLNKNIQKSLIKHRVQDLFNIYHNKALEFVFANRDNNQIKIKECIETENELIRIVKNDKTIVNIFINLLIAEHKELIYGSIFYPHFDNYEYELMEYYQQTIEQYFLTYDNITYNNYIDLHRYHTHNPTHFMFDDGMHFYMFHEMIESKGTKIVDYDDNTEEYNDDFMEFEEFQDDEDF